MRRMLPTLRRFSPHDNTEPAPDPEPEQFYPSLRDVFQVRAILRRGIVPEGLPVEIVDLIVDAAEYWPSVEARISEKIIIRQDGDRECLRTPPLCYEQTPVDSSQSRILPHRGMHPCRKIVFSIASHDQGWGGGYGNRGKHVGAYSWFDAFIIPTARKPDNDADATTPPGTDEGSRTTGQERTTTDAETKPESRLEPFLPTANRLQTNPVATSTTQNFRIVWHYLDSIPADSAKAEEIETEEGRGRATLDGSAVRNMQVGDSVSVWARARFAGWANHVERLSVRVFWAV
ncbi:hypothetical protein VTN00DRAFT_2810 [Thermoascus crustaceus]|uniref:uncharacterized protein n=1 Tax=Thermoascus crustaceus TaxID=5088 RepID=UPI00374364B7